MAKTVRFSELVKKSGQPHVVTLWSDPKKDRDFVKAMRENRILTIKQEPVGAKKDFGLIGFREEKNVSYLIFPKPLPKVGDSKIVGIKYDLFQEPSVTDRVKPSAPKRKPFIAPRSATVAKEEVAPPEPKAPPKEKTFVATIRRTCVWETALTVEARNKAEAEEKAKRLGDDLKMDHSEAVSRTEIRDIREEK